MISLTLENKVAVVTGAGRGIGREVAVTLAREGADVALAARNEAALDETRALVEALGRTGARRRHRRQRRQPASRSRHTRSWITSGAWTCS